MSSALNDSTIRSYSVVEASSFIRHLFPEALTFQSNSNQTLSDFWAAFNSLHSSAWADFLAKLEQPNNESFIQIFLSVLTARVTGSTSMKTLARSWSAASCKGKHAGGDTPRKPDLVCFDSIKRNENDWSHFVCVGELKSGNFKDVYELLAERAAVLFRNQDARRFVLTFALVKRSMTVALFDRGGSVVSEAFDIRDHPLLFLQFILGVTLAPLTSLGYDCTITTYPKARTISSKHIPNVHLICTLYVADRIHGRGTVVWIAKLKGLSTVEVPGLIRKHFGKDLSVDPTVIIKDIWNDENGSLTEGMILALLKFKGVQGVPRILAEERVLSGSADDEIPFDPLSHEVKPSSIPADARPDSTTLIRSRLNLPRLQLCAAALKTAQALPTQSDSQVVEGFEARAHIRSYLTPWAAPIFQFRSGVELLGVVADALTAHEQAASSCFVTKPDPFPFRFLHRDISILNIGMVPSKQSDFPACPYRLNGEYRGLLYDWGFAKVAEVKSHGGFQGADVAMDEDEDVILASSDTDTAPRSTIYVPAEDRTDSGLYTATPDIIEDFEVLVKLVRHCIREEEPVLEITGTRPFMAIELLVASFVHTGKNHPWKDSYKDLKHEVRHDLEAFYMVLLSLCLIYEQPHRRKGFTDCDTPGSNLLPEGDVLSYCAVIWLTGQEDLVLSNIRLRYLALCTRAGFGTMVQPYLSGYFAPMAPYLEQIRQLLYGESQWHVGPYKRPDTCPTYSAFRNILLDAMKTIPSTKCGSLFSRIVEPTTALYCPISPDGQWQGKPWSWEEPFPMRSNNAFGFVQDQLTTPSTPQSSSGGSLKMPGVMAPLRPAILKTRGLQASGRYALIPENDRQLTQRIKYLRGSTESRKGISKPYRVYSPSQLLRRRKKWVDSAKETTKVGPHR